MGIRRYLSMRLFKYNSTIKFNNIRMFFYKKVYKLKVGKDTMIWVGNSIYRHDKIIIGKNSIIGPENVFLAEGGIRIGDNVNISGYSHFISQYHDVNDPEYKTIYGEIIIDDYAWIATHAMILPGVHVGKGAVVAAGSVVVKDVEPYTIVAGNPAKVVGKRTTNLKYTLNSMRGIKWN